MKNILAACVMTVAVGLGGCASTGGGSTGGSTPADIVAQVQSYTRIACAFVPTAASVVQIISGGNAGVMTASAIAQAICNAVAPPMMAGKVAPKSVKGWQVAPGSVNGVRVDGTKVR